MSVQFALMLPVRDLGWILAGVGAVVVAVLPLAVLMYLARPSRTQTEAGSPRAY